MNWIIGSAAGVVLLVLIGLLFVLSYVKAPPDTAFIISGRRKEPKIVVARATFRMPFLERLDKIPLNLLQVDIKTASAVPTSEFINIFVDGVANVKISNKPASVRQAAENFLGRKKEEIAQIAREVLEGNMREIVGKMKLTELVQDREKFAIEVKQSADEDFARMGMEIINLTIQNFSDKNNVIEDLGVDNVAQIRKTAQIAKANSDRDVEIATSAAKESANLKRTEAEALIAQQNTQLEIKKAELKTKSEIERARAEASYEIQNQEQQKSIGVARVNAEIATAERETDLQDQNIKIAERELDVTIKKKADADRYAQQQKSEADLFARQKEAEALKFEAIKAAEALQAKADADVYVEQQKAVAIKAVGEAEAEAITKRAEAQKKMGEASILEMYFGILPEVVKNAAEPLSKTNSITMYGEGNSAKLVGDVMKTSNQIIEAIGQATGIDLKSILAAKTAE